MIFYDIEQFKQMNLAGFLLDNGRAGVFVNAKGLATKTLTYDNAKVFINDVSASRRMLSFLNELIGFNNHHYDDFLIEDLLNGDINNCYKISQAIIYNHQYFKHPDFTTFDTREQLPPNFSLKKFEAMNGLPVEESKISFDKDDNFTFDEVLEVIHYNLQDIKATKELYSVRNNAMHGEYFKSKQLLLDEYALDRCFKNYTNGSIAASFLMGYDHLKNLEPYDPKINGVSNAVADFLKRALKDSVYVSSANTKEERAKRRAEKAPTMMYEEAFGNVYKWAWGGLHSAVGHLETTENGKERAVYDKVDLTDVYQLDVTSMFPNIMIRDELLGPATDRFRDLVAERIENKKAGKPVAKAQKIIINSSYGLMRLPSSRLFNPSCAIHVNVAGMVAVFNLCSMLHEQGCAIIQTNTDGVAFQLKDCNKDEMMLIKEQWEQQFDLKLELSHFKRFIQKDVNNYIAVKDNDSLKLKGGAVSQATSRDSLKASTPAVIDKMLVAYLVDKTPALSTLLKDNKMIDFCFTLSSQIGASQTGALINENGNELPQRVNRVYCSKSGQRLYKELRGGRRSKFADLSDRVTLVNQDVRSAKRPNDLDVAYYLKLFQKKLAQWVDL